MEAEAWITLDLKFIVQQVGTEKKETQISQVK